MAQVINENLYLRPSQIFNALKWGIENNFNFLVTGRPGIGKTDLMKQVAAAANVDLVFSHPVIEEPTDSKGLYFPVMDRETGKRYAAALPTSELKRLLDSTRKTVCFIDDFGQAALATQAAKMQWIWGGQVNGFKIPDHVLFYAATNRREDKAHVQGMIEPLKSRFYSILYMETDLNDWLTWGIKAGMPIDLLSFIRWKPNYLKAFTPTMDLVNSPNPRTIANMGKMVNAGMPPGLEFALVAGAVGETMAAEYLGFRKIYKTLPNPDLVLMQPQGAPIPEDPATLWALTGALAARTNDVNISNLVVYLDRMVKADFGEFTLKTMDDVLTRNPELANTSAYIKWTTDNTGLVI